MIVALFLTTFTVQPIRIPSGSMEPTLLVGDFLLLDRQAVSGDNIVLMPPTGVSRGDVVVFHDPVEDPSVHLVKRVIGLPGDRIYLRGNRVFVNDRPLKEPYAVYRASLPDGYRDEFPNLSTMDARVDPAWWIRLRGLVKDGEITVPAGDYFVLGDNRNESDDSRYWGFVPRNYIVGEPVMVYFSYRQPDGEGTRGWKAFARWHRIFHVVR
jgi:signal peptidase I